MATRRRVVALTLAAAVLAGGCWDAREIDDRILVTGLALDAADEAQPGAVEVTLQVALPRAIVGGVQGENAGSGAPATILLHDRGRNVQEAMRRAQTQAEFRLFFGHLQVVLVGQELARHGLVEELKSLLRDPEVRRLTPLAVARGRARDLLARPVPTEQISALAINRFLDEQFRLGRGPLPDLGRFMADVSTPGVDPLLPLLAPSPAGVAAVGSALFEDDRLVGTLDMEDTWFLLWLRRVRRGPVLSVPVSAGGGSAWVDVFHVETQVVPRRTAAGWRAHVRTDLEVRIMDASVGLDLNDSTVLAAIARDAERYFRQRLRRALAQVARLGVDPVGLGREFLVRYPAEPRQLGEEAPRTIPVELEVRVRVRRTTLIAR